MRAPTDLVSGGIGLSIRMAARLNPCFARPVHLIRFKTQRVTPLSGSRVKTMTAITTVNCANEQAHGALDPIRLHAEAHNALNMACYYLRQPKVNTIAAHRKAMQALAALRCLSRALEG